MSARSRRKNLEIVRLEDRSTPATFTATTFADLVTTGVDLATGKLPTGEITLRSAILAANATPGADTVVAPAGTYLLTLAGSDENLGRIGDLDITEDATLEFTGAIIDAASIVDRVLHIPTSTAKVVVNGGTLQNGRIDDDPFLSQGGGILNTGNLTLNDVVVFNNRAIGLDATIEPVESITTPPTDAAGGGIASFGPLTITGGEIRDNIAQGGSSILNGKFSADAAALGLGGGIFIQGAPFTITGTRITNNIAQGGSSAPNSFLSTAGSGEGGGLFVANISAGTLIDVKIDNNQALGGAGINGHPGGPGLGGGLLLFASQSTLNIDRSTFEANLAKGGSGSPAFGNPTQGGIGGNANGGAIYLEGSSPTLNLSNSTLFGNIAHGGDGIPAAAGPTTRGQGRAGAILFDGFSSAAKIVHATITENEAVTGNGDTTITTFGGGLVNVSFGGFPLTVQSSIVAGNQAPADPDIGLFSSFSAPDPFISQGFNLIGISKGGQGFTNGVNNDQVGSPTAPIDPQLSPSGFFGGSLNAVVFGLNPGSPARDAGGTGVGSTDQRGAGFDRVIGSAADVGAFEVQIPASVSGTPSTPIVEGQPYTIVATVADPRFQPTGDVTLLIDGSPQGTGTLDPSGNFLFTLIGPASGPHTFEILYSGDAAYLPESSSLSSFIVNGATSTTVSVSVNPVFVTQPVTLTASVTSTTPGSFSGDVQFFANGSPIGSPVPVSPTGDASLTVPTGFAVGNVPISATYSGDPSFGPSSAAPVTLVVQPIPTTTGLSLSVNPVLVNQPVTFTATVTPSLPGVPTGTVQFFANGSPVGSPVTVSPTGDASLTVPTGFAVGNVPVSATYSGDLSFGPSSATPVTLVVQPIPTTTSVTIAANPVLVNQPVTFTATVTPSVAGVPTGAVQFAVEGSPVGTPVSLDASGVATFTATAGFAAGSLSVTATYLGETNFTSSNSPPVTLTVNRIGTTTTVSASPNPAFATQAITLTATVSSPNGTPTGTVQFSNNGTVLGTANLTAGVATISLPSGLAVGTSTITADYVGTPVFLNSTATPLTLTVNAIPTTTQLNISPSSPVVGAPVTLIATVAGSFSTPSGSVNFFVDSTLVGTGTLNASGVASFTLPNGLALGSRTLAASYPGVAGVFLTSAASPITLNVATNASTTDVIASPNPVLATDPIVLSASVFASNGIPTGTVEFFVDGTSVGTAPLDNTGFAEFLLPDGLVVGDGDYTITASYSGDGSTSGSISLPDVLVVNAIATRTTLTLAPNPSVFGEAVTLTANVSFDVSSLPPSAPDNVNVLQPSVLTGSVQFLNGTTVLGTVPIVNGVATLTITNLPVGTNVLTANFQPATNDLILSRGTATQVVNPAPTVIREIFAAGLGFGVTSVVKVYDADGNELRSFIPFGVDFTCGAVVATADVTGDGVEDVIVSSAIGGGPHVKVYDGVTFDVVTEFFAFEPGFRGGISLAAGDLTGDGIAEIVTGAGPGGGPVVSVFSLAGSSIRVVNRFFAYDPSLRSGVSVAVFGGLLATGPGFTAGPEVRVFRGPGSTLVSNFFAFDPASRNGVNVALAFDGTNTLLLAGTGAGRGPVVNTFNALTGTALTNATLFEPGFIGGVTATNVQTTGAVSRIAYGTGLGGGPRVRLFGPNNTLIRDFFAFEPELRGGVFVG